MFECMRRANTVVRASRTLGQKHRLGFHLFVHFGLLVLFLRPSNSSVSLGAHLVCGSGLTDKQQAMCRSSPLAVSYIGKGLRMAYSECRSQLAGARWNCSGVGENSIYGHYMPLATKEAALIYAITSAGAVHELSKACARGDLPACRCKTANRRRSSPSENFVWGGGGCGETTYGDRFVRRFLDSRELEKDARSLMNLHNNRVGRKIVKDLVRREQCKCHGVSGSCSIKTCWKPLPSFQAIAAALKQKYLRAKFVTSSTHMADTHLVVRRSKHNIGPGRIPRKSELVFLQPSPLYCDPDPEYNIVGTHGRYCNRTSKGEAGCESLCCGRGYITKWITEQKQCNCKFDWCCYVTCDTCKVRTEVHICN